MTNGVSEVTLDVLIRAALTGAPYHQQRLGNEAKRYARKISNRLGRDLPEDLHGDVCNEAFAMLFSYGPDALVGTTGLALFHKAILAAIRTVRANSAPPGQRTRRYLNKAAKRRVAADDAPNILSDKALAERSVGEGLNRALDFDQIADAASLAPFREAEARMDSAVVLGKAPIPTRLALNRIFLQDRPMDDVARSLKMSRFALRRRLETFATTWRAAA